MAEYYKHEIAKWNVATDDLTLEQEAAYHRVVAMIRLYERPLAHNLRVLSGLWRCNERKAKRLLDELISAGKLTVDAGLIIDEKAVNDASTLRQTRIDKQLAGSRGGIESGKSRRKSLENKDTGEAPASTREEKAREEKIKDDVDDAGAGALRDGFHGSDLTDRERVLIAMGCESAITSPSSFIGGQEDTAEMQRWLQLPGLTIENICDEIRAVMARKPGGTPPSRFRYFRAAMENLSGALTAPALAPAAGQPARSAAPTVTASEILARIRAQDEAAAKDTAQ